MSKSGEKCTVCQSNVPLFEALIKHYPDNPWGYIGWGDMYATEPRDLETARRIYEMGLNPMVKDTRDIIDRLKTLENER